MNLAYFQGSSGTAPKVYNGEIITSTRSKTTAETVGRKWSSISEDFKILEREVPKL